MSDNSNDNDGYGGFIAAIITSIAFITLVWGALRLFKAGIGIYKHRSGYWNTLDSREKLSLILVVATIFFIAIAFSLPRTYLYSDMAENFLILGIVSAIVGAYFDGGFTNFWGRDAEVEKDDEDLLSTQENQNKVTTGLEKNRNDGVFSGEINGKRLFVSCEDRAVVIGPPATGKTSFLISQILEWASSGRSFVVNDIKPEIYGIVEGQLREKGYNLVRFNPGDPSADCYNLLDDLSDVSSVAELAEGLIPSGNEDTAAFSQTAKDLLEAIIAHIKAHEGNVSLPAVRRFMRQFETYKELFKELKFSDSEIAQDAAANLSMLGMNERLLGSVFATLRMNLRFLRIEEIEKSLTGSDFSLSALTKPKTALFLQFEEKRLSTLSHFFGVMMAHIMRYLIDNTNRPPVLLLFDEIGNAPAIPSFSQTLNTIRSRNMPLWTYWQSLEQMQRYGVKADEGPNIILGACDFQMVFRLNDNASANWMSERIGTVDRTVHSTSVDNGGFDQNVTYSKSLVTEAVVESHELQSLNPSQVVCTYRGMSWKGIATPYFKKQVQEPQPEEVVESTSKQPISQADLWRDA